MLANLALNCRFLNLDQLPGIPVNKQRVLARPDIIE
jgi:hypothetical protein